MYTMTQIVLAKEANAPKSLPPLIFERIVIHLDDDESDCSSPVSECSNDIVEVPKIPPPLESMEPVEPVEVQQVQPSLLAAILDEYREALKQEVPSLSALEAFEQAVVSYLYYYPATVGDVELLVPEFALKPTIVGKLASNIGYFHSKCRISEQQVEDIYVALIVQGDPLANHVFEQVRPAVLHFKRQAEENRAMRRQYKQQCQEYAAWCLFQQQQVLMMGNSAAGTGINPPVEPPTGNMGKRKKKKRKSSYVPGPAVHLESLNEWEQVEAQQKSEAQLFRHWKKKYTVRIPISDDRTVRTSVAPKPLVRLPSPEAVYEPDPEPLPPDPSRELLPVINKITCLHIR